MATWRADLQRWSWAEGDTDPIRYCFVDPEDEEAEHPAKGWTDAEKAAARHAIGEWNEALRRSAVSRGGSDRDRIAEAGPDEPCDVTLRWEDGSFFRDYRTPEEESDGGGHGLDLRGTPGYADRLGGGSLEEVPETSLAPFTPDRDTEAFPRGEVYFNTEPSASISDFKGWFVDPTPDDDGEFEEVESDTVPPYRKLAARRGGPADDRIDFYTAAKHEFGHMLGLDHHGKAGENGDSGQVMAGGVGGQERRHKLPISEWMEKERRHLTPVDVDLLESHYDDEFADRRSWFARLLAALLGFLGLR